MSIFNKVLKQIATDIKTDVNKKVAQKTSNNVNSRSNLGAGGNGSQLQKTNVFQQQIDEYEASNPGVLKLIVRKGSEDPGISLAGVNKLINNEIVVPSIVSKVYSFGNWSKETSDVVIKFEDCSKLISVKDMFAKSEFNNLDVSNFDVKNFKTLKSLFMSAKIKNLKGIDKWDLGNQKDLTQLFIFAKIDNIEGINDLDVSNVEDFKFIFRDLETNSLDLSNWNIKSLSTTSNSKDSFGMSVGVFQDSKIKNLKGIENWDTSNVTCLIGWFHNASIETLDLGNWNVSKVENMSFLFEQYKGEIKGIDKWDVSNLKNMRKIFNSAKITTTIDLSKWDVSNVENMSYSFAYTSMNDQDLSNWNTSNVSDMENIFNKCAIKSVGDLSNWDVSKVKVFSFGFSQTVFSSIGDLSNWNVCNADVTQMFGRCKLTNIGSVSNWRNNKHQESMTQGSTLKLK